MGPKAIVYFGYIRGPSIGKQSKKETINSLLGCMKSREGGPRAACCTVTDNGGLPPRAGAGETASARTASAARAGHAHRVREGDVAVSMNWESISWGHYHKSPTTILGSILGPLTFGSSDARSNAGT